MLIESHQTYPYPHAQVLAWHQRPGAFVRLTPPGLASPTQPQEGGTAAGRRVAVRFGPPVIPDLLRPTWTFRHVKDDGRGNFSDRQVSGPWRTWMHSHRITESGPEETIVRDSIDADLPVALLPFSGIAADQVRELLAFRDRQLRADLAFHAQHSVLGPQRIAVTGASGMLGTQICALLETGGHEVYRLVRRPPARAHEIFWDPQRGILDPADLESVDTVINLAGRSIGARWTPTVKREILTSRVQSTQLLACTIATMSNGPRALVQGSAIGYYGSTRPGEVLAENARAGTDFLSDVARDWEAATGEADRAGVRTPRVRTGVVLSDGGGALLPQLPLYFMGLGGRLSEPGAVISWITLDDVIRAFAHAALTEIDGPVNAVAPQPATAAEFAQELGSVMGRPSVIPVPALGPRLVLGREAAEGLVRADQNVSAQRLLDSGFEPAHPTLAGALRHILRRGSESLIPGDRGK